MDVKYLIALTEIANDVVYFFARIIKHLGNGALTEIQAMVGTCMHVYESLEPVYRPEHPSDPSICLVANAWVLRMARQPYLILLRDRHDYLQEMVYAFPHHLCRRIRHVGQRLIQFSVVEG